MYTVLARKWRPQIFEDLVGQQTVTQTLQNAIKEGRIHHAFLFAGPRGVGKTTCARILAKALNCNSSPTPVVKPCNECPSCVHISNSRSMDVLEIDGASNRGIDEVRELRLLPGRLVRMDQAARGEPVQHRGRFLESGLRGLAVLRRQHLLDRRLQAGPLRAVVIPPLALLPDPLFRTLRVRQFRSPACPSRGTNQATGGRGHCQPQRPAAGDGPPSRRGGAAGARENPCTCTCS